MPLRALPMALLLGGSACGGKDGAGDDSGGGGGGGGSDDSTAPEPACADTVPPAYQGFWDYQGAGCDDKRTVYHLATGSSDGAGGIALTENWYWFWDGGESCEVDTFAIEGEEDWGNWGDTDPCSYCEESYHATWTLTAAESTIDYEKLLTDEKDEIEEQVYEAYLMIDTHNELNDERNADNELLAIALFRQGTSNSWNWNTNYARGTATPTDTADGPPQDYEMVSSVCVTVSR